MPTVSNDINSFLLSANDSAARSAIEVGSPVSVKWFGAVGDGVTDDTAAIQAAADACAASGDLLTGPPGNYLVTSTITINCNCDLQRMTFSANASSVSPVIRTGLTSGTSIDAQFKQVRRFPIVRNTAKIGTGWSGFSNSVGIDVGNLFDCRLEFTEVTGFGIGIDLGGYNRGVSYNDIFVGRLFNNLVNLKIGAKESEGWANENNFFGGRFAFNSTEGANISGARCILLTTVNDAINSPPNNNVFYKPSVEGDGAEFQIDIQGSFNTIINPRFENTPPKIRFYSATANQTNSNVFMNGYKLTQPTFTFAGETSPYNKWIGSRLNDSLEYTGCGVSIVNKTGATVAAPQLQGFAATANAIEKTASSTDWMWRLFAGGMAFKRAVDATDNHRLRIDEFGRFNLGQGTGPPDVVWRIGTGSPEGAIVGAPGSMFLNVSGGAGTTLYVKETGTGNTGWVAK